MGPERILSAQAVEEAEQARREGDIQKAAEISGKELGYPNYPLHSPEVEVITGKREQRLVLACLARIHVDSEKTLANRSYTPWQALEHLEHATDTIQGVYRNEHFWRTMAYITRDHLGREHHFRVEMTRDWAETLRALGYLLPTKKPIPKPSREGAVNNALRLLWNAQTNLPEDSPTKNLIRIEHQLLRLEATRRWRSLPTEGIAETLVVSYYNLQQAGDKVDPQRLAVVGAWLVYWGGRIEDPRVVEAGQRGFKEVTQVHPEFTYLMDDILKRYRLQAARTRLFDRVLLPMAVVSSPITRFNTDRNQMYRELTSLPRF